MEKKKIAEEDVIRLDRIVRRNIAAMRIDERKSDLSVLFGAKELLEYYEIPFIWAYFSNITNNIDSIKKLKYMFRKGYLIYDEDNNIFNHFDHIKYDGISLFKFVANGTYDNVYSLPSQKKEFVNNIPGFGGIFLCIGIIALICILMYFFRKICLKRKNAKAIYSEIENTIEMQEE